MVKSNDNLNPVPLADVWPPRPGTVYATISPGQRDPVTEAVYANGGVLIEVDDEERITRAYRHPQKVA